MGDKQLIDECRKAAETLSDHYTVGEFAAQLIDNVSMNMEFAAIQVRQRLKAFLDQKRKQLWKQQPKLECEPPGFDCE